MLPVEEALKIVLENTPALDAEEVLLSEAAGRVLAERVFADADVPPFDRSTMDGYALVAADTAEGTVELEVVESIYAGDVPAKIIQPGQAAKIMTGAPLPEGADCVVMVEQTQEVGEVRVRIVKKAKVHQNITFKAQFVKEAETLLEPGRLLRPVELGMMAFVGAVRPKVSRRPKCTVLSTGDELVEPHEIPGPGQIRNSNAFCLASQLEAAGAEVRILDIGRDDLAALTELVRTGLDADVFVSTGGVSVGEKDLVGRILHDQGVQVLFDRVAVKPGKPTLFGRHESGLVFGLPGNPVSAMVTCELFVIPALHRMMSKTGPEPTFIRVRRGKGKVKPLNRRQFLPALLRQVDSEYFADLVPTFGSGDLISVTCADGLTVFQENEEIPEVGAVIPYLQVTGAAVKGISGLG